MDTTRKNRSKRDYNRSNIPNKKGRPRCAEQSLAPLTSRLNNSIEHYKLEIDMAIFTTEINIGMSDKLLDISKTWVSIGIPAAIASYSIEKAEVQYFSTTIFTLGFLLLTSLGLISIIVLVFIRARIVKNLNKEIEHIRLTCRLIHSMQNDIFREMAKSEISASKLNRPINE